MRLRNIEDFQEMPNSSAKFNTATVTDQTRAARFAELRTSYALVAMRGSELGAAVAIATGCKADNDSYRPRRIGLQAIRDTARSAAAPAAK